MQKIHFFCMDGTIAPQFVSPHLPWSYSSAASLVVKRPNDHYSEDSQIKNCYEKIVTFKQL